MLTDDADQSHLSGVEGTVTLKSKPYFVFKEKGRVSKELKVNENLYRRESTGRKAERRLDVKTDWPNCWLLSGLSCILSLIFASSFTAAMSSVVGSHVFSLVESSFG